METTEKNIYRTFSGEFVGMINDLNISSVVTDNRLCDQPVSEELWPEAAEYWENEVNAIIFAANNFQGKRRRDE